MLNKLISHTLLSIAAILLLSSCASKHNDGPPGYNVDVSRIPNAVPKHEPLAKYGNMRSYAVFGKRYYPLKSSKNYVKTGVASWYGTKFNTHRTSSGEPYNMLSMTAAHKTLPLPTYVEVTNLKNNRKVIVKVNDRGPFSSNRLIDLSYVAAKKLGMLGRGTTNVRVRALDPDSSAKPIQFVRNKSTDLAKNFHYHPKMTPTHLQAIYLQVGAFKNKSYAQHMKDKLIDLIPAPIMISRSSTGSRLYLVRVGPFKTKMSAQQIVSSLRNLGIKSHTIM